MKHIILFFLITNALSAKAVLLNGCVENNEVKVSNCIIGKPIYFNRNVIKYKFNSYIKNKELISQKINELDDSLYNTQFDNRGTGSLGSNFEGIYFGKQTQQPGGFIQFLKFNETPEFIENVLIKVRINNNSNSIIQTNLAMHEFGHGLGLGHNNDINSIMNPNNIFNSYSYDFTLSDIQELRSLGY